MSKNNEVVDEHPFKWERRANFRYLDGSPAPAKDNREELFYLSTKDTWLIPTGTGWVEGKYSQACERFGKDALNRAKRNYTVQYFGELAGFECGHWQISPKTAVLVYGDEAQPIEPEGINPEQTYFFLSDVFGEEKALVLF